MRITRRMFSIGASSGILIGLPGAEDVLAKNTTQNYSGIGYSGLLYNNRTPKGLSAVIVFVGPNKHPSVANDRNRHFVAFFVFQAKDSLGRLAYSCAAQKITNNGQMFKSGSTTHSDIHLSMLAGSSVAGISRVIFASLPRWDLAFTATGLLMNSGSGTTILRTKWSRMGGQQPVVQVS